MQRTVLVVDDDPAIRELLSDVLNAAGWAVAEAADGEAALVALARARPDVVLTDVWMPGLDGPGLLRRLRDGGDDVPVVLMTAHARDAPIPGVPFVAKPFALERLLRTVASTARAPVPGPEALGSGNDAPATP
jgi:CheY-like chemotaxis protein